MYPPSGAEKPSAHKLGPVAQRSEQGTHNPLVVGSNPTGPTSSNSIKSIENEQVMGKFWGNCFRLILGELGSFRSFMVAKVATKSHRWNPDYPAVSLDSGRRQTICASTETQIYDLISNFQRWRWFLCVLFSTRPARLFPAERAHAVSGASLRAMRLGAPYGFVNGGKGLL